MPRPTTPSPRPSLAIQAEDSAHLAHRHRLGELRELAPLLGQLDGFVDLLAQRGLQVPLHNARLSHHRIGQQRRKVLRLDTNGIFSDATSQRWMDALLSMGFVELHRTESAYPTALMRNGTLLLEVDTPRDKVAIAKSALAYAERATRQAIATAAEGTPA